MKKKLLILVSILIIYSCQFNSKNNDLSQYFTETNKNLIESVVLSPSSNHEEFILNKDSTYTKIEESNFFSVGQIEPKGDSLIFHPKNMINQNLLLRYILKEEKRTKNITIQSYDKTGKPIENLEVILISKHHRYSKQFKQGQLTIADNLYDSIMFPQLEKLTARKHRFPLSSHNDLMLYLNINREILHPKITEFRYHPNEIFILFHSFEEIF